MGLGCLINRGTVSPTIRDCHCSVAHSQLSLAGCPSKPGQIRAPQVVFACDRMALVFYFRCDWRDPNSRESIAHCRVRGDVVTGTPFHSFAGLLELNWILQCQPETEMLHLPASSLPRCALSRWRCCYVPYQSHSIFPNTLLAQTSHIPRSSRRVAHPSYIVQRLPRAFATYIPIVLFPPLPPYNPTLSISRRNCRPALGFLHDETRNTSRHSARLARNPHLGLPQLGKEA